MHHKYLEWAERYGRVFRLRLLHLPIVVVSDPLLALEALGKGGKKELPKAPEIYNTGVRALVLDAAGGVVRIVVGGGGSVATLGRSLTHRHRPPHRHTIHARSR